MLVNDNKMTYRLSNFNTPRGEKSEPGVELKKRNKKTEHVAI